MTGWIRTLLGLAALALALPATAQPPLANTPAIAAKRDQLMKAPFEQRPVIGAELLKLLAAQYGEESQPYVDALQLHASDLGMARQSAEAQRVLERVIALLTKMHGADAFPVGRAQQNYALMLRLNGFPERAIEPARRHIAILTEEAYGCGRVTRHDYGRMVAGCIQDEKDLGDALFLFGDMMIDLKRADEANALFRDTIARFEPRWAGCETDQWGTKCDRAARNRRDVMADYARFLTRAGREPAARAIYADNARARVEALPGCADDACRADLWLLGDFRAWLDAETRADAKGGHDLGFRWLPVFAAEPAYARGAAADADYFDRQYRSELDELLAGFTTGALAAGERDRLLALLTPLGKADLVGDQDRTETLTARLADLDTAFDQAAYGDHAARAAILRDKAEVLRQIHGDKEADYLSAMRAVAWEIDDGDDDAATDAAYRDAYAAYRHARGDANALSWSMASSYADWLVRRDRRADAAALVRTLLADPGNDMTGFYADPLRASTMASGLSALSDPHGDLNELHADLAEWILRDGGDAGEALRHARHAATGKRAYRRAFGFAKTDEAGYAQATDDDSFFNRYNRRYAGFQTLFADALWAAGQRDPAATADVFLALQEAQMGTTSQAVAKAAADRALARAGVSDLLAQRRGIDAAIDRLMAEGMAIAHADETERQRLIRVNLGEQQRLAFQRDEIDRRIRAGAPGYFELIRPAALDVAAAQALLGPDEALLMIVPSEFGTHSLALTRTAIAWHRSDLTAAALAAPVRRLLWDVGASLDFTEEEDARWSAEGEGDFPFDRATAWGLYDQLVRPLEDVLAGKRHLFTASGGALSSLPLGILVTAPPQGVDGDPAALRATPWLADRHALLQLPSLQSLQLLRAVADRNAARSGTAMVGFGDPVLEGAAQTRGGIGGRHRGTRSAAGLEIADGLRPAGDGPPLADPDALRKLARLPGTESELKAMQALLGAGNSRLYLADAATETNVKRGKLSGLSVLFLATHGLVAGEVGGIAEPGLVFTPPRSATVADDGLLTASEVAALDLGARWVILSACNTASGDGSAGAPGLSGLARSFFFAGAESLLASHWPVRDDVAAVMTVRLFELMQANPGLSRAEALQRAAREIRQDPRSDAFLNSWAHPSAWAPFSLIGDGID
ncbi:MAG: hypothetical protein DI569_14895 [Sphingopyxis macrogoltabida]|uniref:CHAT domain-containing protein n=1 Tax=Sphingopyxis macrogoltabida TaxID=33050 RepID=A0A2W5L162_SPHMC|nr:MAG: hypothetical protein DI569_14895 [Sphingopyxis macrogoltabida]